MSDHQRSTHSLRREVGASADGAALLSTLVHLWPYIWPAARRDLKARVVFATLLIFAAKFATIAVPFTFKWATDALAGHGTAPVGPDNVIAWAVATPIVMRLAMRTFEHMHLLSLRFHLERKTGGLTHVLERGRNGIETIVRMVLLQLAPTVVEIVLVAWVLLFHFDWRYLVIILVTVALYIAFTFYATEWRIAIPREMNAM